MRRTLTLLLIVFGFDLFWNGNAYGQTIAASSCLQSDVQSALSSAAAGSTIMLPAGTCTWTSSLSVSIGVSIIGAGQGSTIILDDINQAPMFSVTLPSASSFFRLSAVALEPSSSLTGAMTPTGGGTVANISGTCSSSTCSQIRVDHILMTGWVYSTYGASTNNFDGFYYNMNDVFGVLDHWTVSEASFGEIVDFNYGSYLGVGSYGDNSWAQPDSLGTANALFVENGTFTDSGAMQYLTETEHEGGGRFVVRDNTLSDTGVYMHGTETTNRNRGGRQFEVYNNNFTFDSADTGQSVMTARSGTGLFFNNTIATTSGGAVGGVLTLGDFRTFSAFSPWGWCDGTGQYDQNDSSNYFSGTFTAVSNTTTPTETETNSQSNWATSQWVNNGDPYSLVDTTQGFGFEIVGDTNTTLTVDNRYQDVWNQYPSYSVGDSFAIMRAAACIDQPGHGQGSLISGATPTPTGWVNEALDPIYFWGNSFSGTNYSVDVSSDTAKIINDRDYYLEPSNQAAQSSTTVPFNAALVQQTLGSWSTNGSTATVSVTATAGLIVGDTVLISGSTGASGGWNIDGPWTLTGVTSTSFTFQDTHASSSNATPMTGVVYSSGLGHGLLSYRPTTCTTGAAYWATDANNANGELYSCTASNTWTAFYTPYTYPHPLDTSTSSSITPPTNLTVTAVH